ncbi:MAG: hypothetical protein HY815_13795, partial [Candidatus Riflebacteria bacterium]|nr:hypothetical protein [Candidatus Riflebacteria bacterium]
MLDEVSIEARGPQLGVVGRTADEIRDLPGFLAELRALEQGDAAARLPLVLICRRCAAFFPWFVTQLGRVSAVGDPNFSRLGDDWEPDRWNLTLVVRDQTWCPSCRRVNDHRFPDDPGLIVDSALSRLSSRRDYEGRALRARLVIPIVCQTIHGRRASVVEQILECEGTLNDLPEDPVALYRLANICHNSRLTTRALDYLERSIRQEPRSVDGLRTLAMIQIEQRQWPEAADSIRRAGDLILQRRGRYVYETEAAVDHAVRELLACFRDECPEAWSRADDDRLNGLKRHRSSHVHR